MTTREDLLAFVEEWKRLNPECHSPYYKVYLMEKNNEQITYNYPGQKDPVTFPHTGVVEWEYFDDDEENLDAAIEFLNYNKTDVHEYYFFAAFISVKVPGIPPFCSKETRMYFVWDEEKEGFFQQEEPEIYSGMTLTNYY